MIDCGIIERYEADGI